MNLKLLEKLVNALLYEGYLLYPYRPSAIKNKHRFNFGVLAPQAGRLVQTGAEKSSNQTECLVLGDLNTNIDIKIKFLHLLAREVSNLVSQETIEREIIVPGYQLGALITQEEKFTFRFPPNQAQEQLLDASGQMVGVILQRQQEIEGVVEIAAAKLGEQLYKVTTRVLNLTPVVDKEQPDRDEELMQSLISVHTILSVQAGEFISLLDPPQAYCEAAAACRNIGSWPVLVGEGEEKDLILSSPIILYDYPKIAPESAGDLYDATEIDEILTLRIMTLTDEEKQEMRQADKRTSQLLERTETLAREQLMKLHGAMRGLRSQEEKNE